MKRRDLVRHLRAHGCRLLREGSRHSIFLSRDGKLSSAVPRHREIHESLARRICLDLDVPGTTL